MTWSLLDSAFTGASQKERSWKLGLRPDLPCASPRGRSAADQEPGRGWSVSASGSGAGGCFSPSSHFSGEKQRRRRAVRSVLSAASAAAAGCALPPPPRAPSSWLWPPLGTLRVSAPPLQSQSPPGWRRPRCCCWARGQRAALPGSCCCPRLVSLSLSLLRPRAVRSDESHPRKFQSLGLREQRSARTPQARLAGLRASSDCRAARRAPLLKRGWRLPCAHAC